MRILGVDFGSWSIKAVEIESRFRRFEILDVHEVRLPIQMANPTQAYKEAFQQLMARLPSHPEKIATSLNPAQAVLRFLSMPIKQRKKVEKSFRFELEDAVPFRWTDAIVEHHVHRTKDGSLVVAGLALKRHIQTHLDWLTSIGADPDWLTFDGMGVINLYLSSLQDPEQEKKSGPVLLLDIGHHKTGVAIFHEDRLEHFRTMAWGGTAITQSIALNMGVALDEAEKQKINQVQLNADPESVSDSHREIMAAVVQAFSPMLTDLTQNLVSYRNTYKTQVGHVMITGGTSRLKGITDFLEARLQIPVEIFHGMDKYKIKNESKSDHVRNFGEALGRALVFNRKSTLLFNFRQQELVKGTSLNEMSEVLKNPGIMTLLRFAALLAVILFAHVEISSRLAKNDAKAATEEVRKEFTRTFPSVPAKVRNNLITSSKDLKKYVDQKNAELDQRIKVLSKTRTPMLSILRTVSNSFPPTVKVDVNTLQMDDRSFQMEGVLYSGVLDEVTESLKKVSFIKEVSLTMDGQRFTYRGQIIGR